VSDEPADGPAPSEPEPEPTELSASSWRQRTARPLVWVIDIVIGVTIAAGVLGLVHMVRGSKSTASRSTVSTAAAADGESQGCSTVAATGEQVCGPPPMTIDVTKRYSATIVTSQGSIVVALDAAGAPKGVNNFVYLAQHHFYDGLTFHRVVKDFVIQGGDPRGDGSGGPGYLVITEPPAASYHIGDIAYAKTPTDPSGAAGSQFFIITGSEGVSLPPDYGRFGSVSKGLDVARSIEALSTGDGPPKHTVTIKSITIAEN
jgi:cyclophilin family peptidyl-prolyl cis-trans isomerase